MIFILKYQSTLFWNRVHVIFFSRESNIQMWRQWYFFILFLTQFFLYFSGQPYKHLQILCNIIFHFEEALQKSPSRLILSRKPGLDQMRSTPINLLLTSVCVIYDNMSYRVDQVWPKHGIFLCCHAMLLSTRGRRDLWCHKKWLCSRLVFFDTPRITL